MQYMFGCLPDQPLSRCILCVGSSADEVKYRLNEL